MDVLCCAKVGIAASIIRKSNEPAKSRLCIGKLLQRVDGKELARFTVTYSLSKRSCNSSERLRSVMGWSTNSGQPRVDLAPSGLGRKS